MTLPIFDTLLYTVDDGIATVTLNRPEKMNAFARWLLAKRRLMCCRRFTTRVRAPYTAARMRYNATFSRSTC